MTNIAKRIIPLLDRVVIRKIKPAERTASGIYIPEKSQESAQQGEVLAVGPGDKDHSMTLKPGDHVVLPSFGGTSIKISNEDSVFVYREQEIPAKISKE